MHAFLQALGFQLPPCVGELAGDVTDSERWIVHKCSSTHGGGWLETAGGAKQEGLIQYSWSVLVLRCSSALVLWCWGAAVLRCCGAMVL